METVHITLNVARYFIDSDFQSQKGNFYLDKAQKWTENWDHPIKGRIVFLQGLLKFREAESLGNDEKKRSKSLEALPYFDKALAIFRFQNQDDLYVGLKQNPSKCTKEYQRAICMQLQGQILRFLGRIEEALVAFQELTQGQDHLISPALCENKQLSCLPEVIKKLPLRNSKVQPVCKRE